MATKALAAGLPKESWDELTKDMILSAWEFDKAHEDDKDNNRGNNNDDDAFVEVEYGHDDLEEADLMIMTSTAAERDDGNDDDG
jgi:hypothetical protein